MNKELLNLFNADQEDHDKAVKYGTPEYRECRRRELRRRQRVADLIQAGRIQVPEDYYRAAVIFQRGEELDDIWQTHTLAVAAAKLGHRPARWLAAASLDRWLMHQGMPQKYGTSIVPDGNGHRVWDVNPSVSDRERARWDVPSLRELYARARTAPPETICEERSDPWWLEEARQRWHSS